MIHSHPNNGRTHVGTLAEFTAATTMKFKRGDMILITDQAQVRFPKDGQTFAQTKPVSTAGLTQAALVASFGAGANFTAIGAVFADLAAARAAVDTLKTEAQTRTLALEAKVDALLAALKTGNLMASV